MYRTHTSKFRSEGAIGDSCPQGDERPSANLRSSLEFLQVS